MRTGRGVLAHKKRPSRVVCLGVDVITHAEPDCAVATEAPVETVAVEGARSIRRNAAALGAGQMFTWGMTLAWTVVVPRLLGAGGMGMIITGISVVTMLQIAMGGGTALYVTREIVVSPERAARIVASASLLRLILVPLFGLAIVLWAHFADYGPRQDEILYLCGGATAVMLVGEPLLSYFQATERMQYMAIGDGINKASQGLAGIVLVLLGFGAIGFAACWVATAVVVVWLSIRWARRYLQLRLRTTREDLKDIVRGSGAYWTGGLFFTIYAWIDTAMLSLMTNATVVGWYGVPMRLWGTFLIIPSIVSRVFLPRLVKANEQSRGDLKRVARGPIGLVFVLSLPVATAIAVGAAPFVRVVYGAQYAHAVPVLIILGLNLIPMYLNMMLGSVCIAADRQGTWNWVYVGATVFNPALNAVLIPLTQHRLGNGAIGAAIALAVTETLIACAGFAIVGPDVVSLATIRRVGRMALACGGMLLVVDLLGGTGPVVSLLAGGLALCVLALVLGAITREEQRQARGFAQRLGTRVAAPLLARKHASRLAESSAGVGEAAPAEL
jgi:O-antigen/teichoic acid export membrane protein